MKHDFAYRLFHGLVRTAIDPEGQGAITGTITPGRTGTPLQDCIIDAAGPIGQFLHAAKDAEAVVKKMLEYPLLFMRPLVAIDLATYTRLKKINGAVRTTAIRTDLLFYITLNSSGLISNTVRIFENTVAASAMTDLPLDADHFPPINTTSLQEDLQVLMQEIQQTVRNPDLFNGFQLIDGLIYEILKRDADPKPSTASLIGYCIPEAVEA